MTKTAIGIDLGTTYSCVGVYRDGRVEIIANDQGNRTTPSMVAFTDDERLIGDSAYNQAKFNPINTIYDVKRLMGRYFADTEVQQDIKHWPYKVVENEDGKPVIKVNYKDEELTLSPEQVSAMILGKMKEIAESYLGQEVVDAVVTVPAYFNNAQREATKDAGAIAGLNILKIINEPTAAALAYGIKKEGERNVLIFDLGGGTHDVSLLTVDEGLFKVIATAGNTHLGGSDFDNKLTTFCLKEFKNKNKKIDIQDLITNKRVLSKLKSACEKAKRNLSSASVTTIEVESLYEGIDFRTNLTKAKFENICQDDFKKCMGPVEQILKDAKLNKDQVTDIVLVGGSTRIPKIRSMLEEYFDNKELKKDINPDEAVAYGAAIEAAILTDVKDATIDTLVLVDVTPLSLGIETAGGIMSRIINRNDTIPCQKEQIFSTYSDNQPAVTVRVYEGEREFTIDNNLLGIFELSGIPPMPRGIPKILVRFELDNNGILNVLASEESTGNSKKIMIKNDKHKLTKDQISDMIKEAKKYEQDDKKRREKIEARNELENYLYNTRNATDSEELKSKLGDLKFKKLNEIINEAMQWLDENDDLEKEEYVNKQKHIEKIVTPFFMYVYKKGTEIPNSGKTETDKQTEKESEKDENKN